MCGISVIPCDSPQSGTRPLAESWILCYHTCMKDQNTSDLFHYVVNWKEQKVNQMWIQQVTPEWQECGHQYVAIALNPEKNVSMVMSKPRSHYDTLQWVRKFCGSFSLLY
jgi:hypothetical protein